MSNFTNNISDCEGRSAENSTPAKFTQRSWTAQTDGRCPYIPEEDLHIVAFISEGSSGRVYRGTWSTGFQNGNSQTLAVALKWIRGETASSQCQRELDVLAIADHPNIVKFYGYSTGVNAGLPLFAESGTEHSGFFLVMELAPNGSLASLRGALKRLRDSDPVSHMKLTINFSLQIASGLQHLHFNKMLHLDLKPDNILCFNENQVKLCDFGTIKQLEGTDTVATGRCTIQHAAPEVLLQEDTESDGSAPNLVSVATDLYSLGSMLCELFTGKAPWGDRNHFSICAAISRGASPNILQHPWPSNCPQEIVTLIARMLSFSPDERGTLVGACTILCRLLTSLVEQHEVRNIAASKTPPFTFAKSPIPTEVCTGSQNLSQTTADSTLNSGAGSVVLRGDDYPPLFSLSVTSAAPIVSFPVIVGNPPPPAVVNENEPRQSSGNLSTQKNQHQQNQRQHGRGHQMDCQVSPLRQVSQFDDDEHGRLNAYCTEMFTASHDAEGRNVPTVQSPVQPFDRGSVISLCSHNGADSPTPFRLSGEVGLFGPLKYLVSLGSLGPLSTKLDPLAHMHTIAITQSFRLPPDSRIRAVERLEVALKIAQSLRHLHSIGCYHCNLSPSTIFLVGGDVNIGSATKSNLAMEHANDIFSAPEVLAQEAYSPEADLYSLGSVLLFMLTSDEPSTFSRVQWPSYCPHEIKCLAERLLACNPKDRGTLQEAMSAIEKAIIKIVRDVCFPDQSRCNIRSILENHSNPALTLRESLLRLEGYAPPIDRPDVKHICALLTKSNLNATYNKICEFVSSMFAGPVDDSISAIALYTAESEMCYAVNAALNQLGRIEDRGRKTPSYVGPIAWRIYQAVQKIGTPYCGKGFRIMYADRSPMLEKIYANYASYFPQGSLVTFCQFTSFSVENLNVVVRPAIVFVCDNLEGYNVDQYSVQSLNGHSESEILVLPPSSFTCKATPYRFGSAVFVEVSFETFTIQQDL